jgi:hypothetical protein
VRSTNFEILLLIHLILGEYEKSLHQNNDGDFFKYVMEMS